MLTIVYSTSQSNQANAPIFTIRHDVLAESNFSGAFFYMMYAPWICTFSRKSQMVNLSLTMLVLPQGILYGVYT